jgi:hypothetical protein
VVAFQYAGAIPLIDAYCRFSGGAYSTGAGGAPFYQTGPSTNVPFVVDNFYVWRADHFQEYTPAAWAAAYTSVAWSPAKPEFSNQN